MTTVDGLTELQNCDYFMDMLAKEIERASRYGTDLSVLIMDMDNFRGVKHTLGRETGDRILSEVGRIIRSQVRKTTRPVATADSNLPSRSSPRLPIKPGQSASGSGGSWRTTPSRVTHHPSIPL